MKRLSVSVGQEHSKTYECQEIPPTWQYSSTLCFGSDKNCLSDVDWHQHNYFNGICSQIFSPLFDTLIKEAKVQLNIVPNVLGKFGGLLTDLIMCSTNK